MPIHVSIDLSHLAPGPVTKTVSVFITGQAAPAATLLITGTLTAEPLSPQASDPKPTPPGVPQSDVQANIPLSTGGTSGSNRRLSVVGPTDDSTPGIVMARYDFGQDNALAGGHIEHTFTLRNDNAVPVRLDHLQPSCGCTTALVETGDADTALSPPPVSSVVLAPHQEFRIHVSIDPAHLTAGPVEKLVWVYAQGQSEPAAILKTVGTLDPGARFEPGSLDFGRVAAGQTSSRRLTVTVDRRYLPAGSALRLMAGPDITITALPLTGAPPSASSVTQAFQVSISPHAALGRIDGTLSALITNGSGPATAPDSVVPLHGEVVGAISASPGVVAFGMVTAGQMAPMRVTVTGATPATVRALQVRSISPQIRARFLPGTGKAAILEVSLSPRIAAGSLQTQVDVLTPGGQKLTLPVSVYVVEPQSRH